MDGFYKKLMNEPPTVRCMGLAVAGVLWSAYRKNL